MFSKKSSILFSFIMAVIAVLFLPTLIAHAAPFVDFPVTVSQPDGSELHLFASGDEYYNWLHDALGYTVIQDPVTGYYVYADLINGELKPTGYVAGRVDPSSVGLRPYINISSTQETKIRQTVLDQTEQAGGEIMNAPTSGTMNNLVIFIRFSDESEFTNPLSVYTDMLNNSTAGANSLRNYYREVSYNALTINSTLYPTPGASVVSYQDSHARNYYRPYNAVTNPDGYTPTDSTVREHTLLRDAINYVSSLGQFPSGASIDADGDGYVDGITFIVSGSPDGWSELLWPHMWSLFTYTVKINGKTVGGYNLQLDSMINNGVLAHEMGHVLGFPDLYHYSSNGIAPVGAWDVMEANLDPPESMGCYMKYTYTHWISSIPELTSPGTYTLNPLTSSTNNCKKIVSPYSSTEYFVLEYRNGAGSTFENSVPGTGMLVYRINSDETGNAGGPPDEIYIYRPGGTTTANGDVNQANYSSAVGRTAINDWSSPSSFLSNGSYGGLSICNIGASNTTISFDVCSNSAFIISGYVRTSTGTGISGVTMSGLPNGPMTDGNGFYSSRVFEGWSGTVTPHKFNHSFTQTQRIYTNVTSDQNDQNYTGTYQPSGNTILLVDDDDNNPDVRSYYANTLSALGKSYDVWDTNNSDTEPSTEDLRPYDMVIWFTGVEYGGFAGPGSAGESALGAWLEGGGCFLLSSQDYYFDRGLTAFSSTYLGVGAGTSDIGQSTITGSGSVFGGLGPYTLNYPFSNFSDIISPNTTAENAFIGDKGNAAVDKDGGAYRTTFFGFPFEALPSASARQAVMNKFITWCGSLPPTYSISGHVRTSAGQGIGGVTMEGLPANPVTDTNGYYNAFVNAGWSGTVTPQKTSFVLSPPSKSYTGITNDQAAQDYTISCTSGYLCVQVLNQSRDPVGNARVEVYTDLGSTPSIEYTDDSGWAIFQIDGGNYKLIVSSSSNHFLVMKDVTAPGLVKVDLVGTVQVNVNALLLDGSPMANAEIIANPTSFSYGDLGWTNKNGSLTAWITPGTDTFIAWSWNDLYYLVKKSVSVAGTTNVGLQAAALPTGQMPITLTDFPSGLVCLWSDQVRGVSPCFNVASGDVITLSAISFDITPELEKQQSTGTWWYYALETTTFSIARGATYPITAGGNFSITTAADSGSYLPGNNVSITNTIKDGYDNRITYTNTYADSAPSMQAERVIMLDEAEKARPYHSSDINAATNTTIYPHITITAPGGAILSQAQIWQTWYGHNFTLPVDIAVGTYNINLSLDTGPHNGVISANGIFNIRFPYWIYLPLVIR